MLKKDIPPIDYLVEGLIPKAGLVYLFGPPGSFKTNFALYLSMLGADGQHFFDFKIQKKFRTLWIDEENREPGMKYKIEMLKKGICFKDPGCLDSNLLVISSGFRLIIPEAGRDLLYDLLKRHRPDLVVIDSIAKVFPFNERDEKEVCLIYSHLSPLIEEFGTTFLLIHHSRKKSQQQSSRSMEDISGSREFSAMADSMLLLEDHGSYYLLKQVKNRYDSPCPAINFNVDRSGDAIVITYEGMVREKFRRIEQQIADALKKWLNMEKIGEFKRGEAVEAMEALGFKHSNIDSALRILTTQGFLNNETYGKYIVIEGGR